MNTSPKTIRPLFAGLLLAALSAAPVTAQLLPKVLKQPAPARGEQAAPSLIGRWQGTAREAMPGQGELRYPLSLQFSGSHEDLQLQVDGQAKVPVENGQQVTVVIRALYRGRFQDGQLRMRSTQIETRVVEYNEVLPSTPQVLEATLRSGVLSGRAGSEGEGWTSFEARGAGQGQPEPQAVVGFAGSWSGFGTEPGPDGKPMRYPVQLRVSEQRGQMVAELTADLQYPTGDGQTIPIQYRASFQGRDQRGELSMNSSRVSYFIVPQNRTEAGPQQTLRGRIENGVLRIALGADGLESSQLELRLDSGAPAGPGGVVRTGEVEVGDDDEIDPAELEEIDENDPRWRNLPPVDPTRRGQPVRRNNGGYSGW